MLFYMVLGGLFLEAMRFMRSFVTLGWRDMTPSSRYMMLQRHLRDVSRGLFVQFATGGPSVPSNLGHSLEPSSFLGNQNDVVTFS